SPMISGRGREFYRIPMTLYKWNRLRMLARTRLRWKHGVVHRQESDDCRPDGQRCFYCETERTFTSDRTRFLGPTRSRGKSRALRPADDIMRPSRQRA